MASVSGSYRVGNIPTIAAIITLIDAQLTAENARMIVLGGAATAISGSISLIINAENGAAESYAHKITITLSCPTLADTATLTAALSIMATAIEAESDYTTVITTSVSMSTSMSN